MRRRPRVNPYVTNPGQGFERLLVDMNTQKDFLDANAPAAICSRKEVVANIRRIFDWIRTGDTCIVSSTDLHGSADQSPAGLPPHCRVGTPGADKLDFTLLSPRIVLESGESPSLPVDLTTAYRQVIFQKRHTDLWGHPRADRFLSAVRARRIVVFGVGLEHSVRLLTLGLRARGYPVVVIADATGGWNPLTMELALRIIRAKGASLISTKDFLSEVSDRPRAGKAPRREGQSAGARPKRTRRSSPARATRKRPTRKSLA